MEVVDAVYIHIPFCNNICSYCDFCKVYYNKKFIDKYLEKLEDEVKSNYKGEIITTLYIGGGTPSSLDILELERLFSILNIFNKSSDCEITFEANVDSLTLEKIELLKKYGVNRVSLGVETFDSKLQEVLERKNTYQDVLEVVSNLRNNNIYNINLDLMYALPSEDINILKIDLELLLKLDVPHISTYSLILEDNTKLKINNTNYINEDLDREMYDLIRNTLKTNGYIHYEISNFAKEGYQSVHNNKYWQNKEYYGFGVGAAGYLDDIRYTNTKSITKYLDGIVRCDEEVLSLDDKIYYEIILGLRMSSGIDKNKFFERYNIFIDDVLDYKEYVKNGILIEDEYSLRVRDEYFYVLNQILVELIEKLQTNV